MQAPWAPGAAIYFGVSGTATHSSHAVFLADIRILDGDRLFPSTRVHPGSSAIFRGHLARPYMAVRRVRRPQVRPRRPPVYSDSTGLGYF